MHGEPGSVGGVPVARGELGPTRWVGPSYCPSWTVMTRPIEMLDRTDVLCEHTYHGLRGGHPARGPGRFLRVGRAARRPVAARSAGHRRDGDRAGRVVPGQGVRGAHRDGR